MSLYLVFGCCECTGAGHIAQTPQELWATDRTSADKVFDSRIEEYRGIIEPEISEVQSNPSLIFDSAYVSLALILEFPGDAARSQEAATKWLLDDDICGVDELRAITVRFKGTLYTDDAFGKGDHRVVDYDLGDALENLLDYFITKAP